MKDFKDLILPVLVSALCAVLFMYAVIQPISRSEAKAILNERGYVTYYNDSVYIYLPAEPTVIEIEAAAIIAETAEGVFIDILYDDKR